MGLHELDNVHTVNNLAENSVLAVQPRSGNGGDEELRSLCVGPSVRHGEESRLGVLYLEVLVVELATINGLTAHTIAVSEITTLKHEIRNDSVETRTLIVEGLAGGSNTLLTSTKSAEVLGSLGDSLAEETEQDASHRLVVDLNIEEDCVGHLLKVGAEGGGKNHDDDEELEALHVVGRNRDLGVCKLQT